MDVSESPSTVRISPYQTVTKKVISGPEGSIEISHVTTDFQGLSKENKAYFQPKVEAVSDYVKLLPDISNVPKPDKISLDAQQREAIINSGNIPEVIPFMAGARIALAEWQIKRQQRKTESSLRSIHVLHNAASNAVGAKYFGIEEEFRPKTLREKAIATRMGRLVVRANSNNAYTNILEDMNTYTDSVQPPFGESQTFKHVDFDRHKENLSKFEKLHRWSEGRRYEKRREESNRLIHGYHVPIVGERIGLLSFDGLATGGHRNRIKRVGKALRKRDEAVLKSEALRRETKENKAARKAFLTDAKNDLKQSGYSIKSSTMQVGAFAKAFKTELPIFRDNIEAADQAYEDRPEHQKGFKHRAKHEAKMYAMNVHEAGKAVKRAWHKRKPLPPQPPEPINPLAQRTNW